MSRRALWIGIGWLLAATVAHADEVRIRNGETVHLALGARRERAVRLGAQTEGWRVVLDGGGASEAVLRDVTPGQVPVKFRVAIAQREMLLDAARFVAGHAYRLELRGADQRAATLFVYLAPPTVRATHRVVFDKGEASAGASHSDGEIAISAKGSL